MRFHKKKPKTAKQIPIGGVIKTPGSSAEYGTGVWKTHVPVRDPKKCTNCLVCVQYCPENCILHKNGKITGTDMRYCKGCLICVKECPFGALTAKRLN